MESFSHQGCVYRDGYQLYCTDVQLKYPVGSYPSGYKFMEAIVDESKNTVKFVNYGTFDTEYTTTLKLTSQFQ